MVTKPKCFYCGSEGPFSKEHAFPYSLGGGGDDWTLIDCVCAECNNIFSSLERALARYSFDSLNRTAYGPSGRKRKGNSSRMVPLYTDGAFLLADDSDLVFEAGLELGLTPYLRAQIIENVFPKCCITGSDYDEIQNLFSAVSKLKNNICLTVETPIKKGQFFKIMQMSLQENGNLEVEKTYNSPCPVGAWYEDFFEIKERRLTPRIFLDDEKRLVIRATSLEQGIKFLESVMKMPQNQMNDIVQDVKVANMDVCDDNPKGNTLLIRMKILPVLIARAIAKVGMNFVAKNHGIDLARNSAFDEIKLFIKGEIHDSIEEMSFHVNLLDKDKDPLEIFNVNEENHWAALLNIDGDLLFVLKFYGVSGYIVKLGNINLSGMYTIPSFADIFKIDYSLRRTKLLETMEAINQYKK